MKFALTLLTLSPLAAMAAEVSFNRDIRPLLSDNCYYCHGFDEKHREAGLRLDLRESALADNDGVRAVVPGDPGKSELWLRVISKDEDKVMPPPKAHKKPFTSEQRELIKRRIEQGAKYEAHWAFVPPVRAAVTEGNAAIEGGRSRLFVPGRGRIAAASSDVRPDRHVADDGGFGCV